MEGIGYTEYCRVETSATADYAYFTVKHEGIKYQVYKVSDFEKGDLTFVKQHEYKRGGLKIENIAACPESHSYYQWVPYVLVLQGVLFMMPHYRKIILIYCPLKLNH